MLEGGTGAFFEGALGFVVERCYGTQGKMLRGKLEVEEFGTQKETTLTIFFLKRVNSIAARVSL